MCIRDSGGTPALARLSSLKRLSLATSRVTDSGLVALRKVSGLERLVLTLTATTDAGVDGLREAIPGLKVDR